MSGPTLHFIGKPPSEPSLDVIFIHGIAGDAMLTWTSSGGYWPEWVAESNPSMRVCAVNYDYPIRLWAKRQPMHYRDLSITILEMFSNYEVGSRPLVMIAHLYGGVLAKELLRTSFNHSKSSRTHGIWDRCKGVVLLATPSRPHTLLMLLKPFSPRSFPQNDYIEDINTWYRENAFVHDITTLEFAAHIDDHTPPDSTRSGIPGSVAIPIDATMVEISKPDSRNSIVFGSVQNLLERLNRLVISPIEEKARRSQLDDAAVQHPKQERIESSPDTPTEKLVSAKGSGNNAWYKCEGSCTALVFLHGVLSNAASCWLDETTRTYWPELVSKDSRTAAADIFGHLEKYPFRAACKSDSKNLFEFDHRERVRWGNWVSLI